MKESGRAPGVLQNGHDGAAQVVDGQEAALVVDGPQWQRQATGGQLLQGRKVGLHARAIDQRWSQDGDDRAVLQTLQVALGRQLGKAVAILGAGRVVLAQGVPRCRPFTGGLDGAQKDELCHAGAGGIACQPVRCPHVHAPELALAVAVGIQRHMGNAGAVNDGAGARQHRLPVGIGADTRMGQNLQTLAADPVFRASPVAGACGRGAGLAAACLASLGG